MNTGLAEQEDDDRLNRLARNPDLVWGIQAIAAVLGVSRRMADYQLREGMHPAAKQIGRNWVASRRELLRPFVTDVGVED